MTRVLCALHFLEGFKQCKKVLGKIIRNTRCTTRCTEMDPNAVERTRWMATISIASHRSLWHKRLQATSDSRQSGHVALHTVPIRSSLCNGVFRGTPCCCVHVSEGDKVVWVHALSCCGIQGSCCGRALPQEPSAIPEGRRVESRNGHRSRFHSRFHRISRNCGADVETGSAVISFWAARFCIGLQANSILAPSSGP